MKSRSVAAAFWLCLFLVPVACGQGDNFLDLTKFKPAKEEKLFASGGGGVSGSYNTRSPKLPLKITLLSLDRRSYRIGENLIFDVTIKNVGKDIVVIPWSPDRAQIRPDEKGFPPGYLDATLSLAITDRVLGEQIIYGPLLYGSELVPSSLRKLLPGQTVRIRAPSRWALMSADAAHGIISRLPLTFAVRAKFSEMGHTSSPWPEPLISTNSIVVELKKREH